MAHRIDVRNLSFAASRADLENLFGDHGTVCHAEVVVNQSTGRSTGRGIVEMRTAGEARAAVRALNGTPIDGRPMVVEAAAPVEAPAARKSEARAASRAR